MVTDGIFATPRVVRDLESCLFYHTMNLPGCGTITGQWDLRGGVADYLGHVELGGCRVLDVGTASGFLCFSMEDQGADVVGYDLSPDQDWDVVPFAGSDVEGERASRRDIIRRVNNAFWFSHGALDSSARMVYGSVYAMPDAMGMFDVAVFGSILLHLRDPFRALEQAAAFARESILVTDVLPRRSLLIPVLARWFGPCLHFLPEPQRQEPKDAWWLLTPRVVVQMLGVLGFPQAKVTFHNQLYLGRRTRMFTVVAAR
jgi:hypothetical protein